MYQKEFDNIVKTNLPKSVLMFGENNYFIDHYIKLYITTLNASDSLRNMYYDEWDFESAKSFLSQNSLFGGINLLIVKHTKKIPKKELDILIEMCKNNEDNYFFYAYEGLAKDAKSMQASFSTKKGGVWVRLFETNPNEAVNFLKMKSNQIGLDIDHYALQHLALILQNNLDLCMNELDKLAILNIKITSKDIDNLVYSTAPLAIEQLLIDLFRKKDIKNMLSKLLEIGEDEMSILRATQYFVNQIFLFHAYIKLNGTVNSADILGYKLPPKIEEQKASLALKVKSASLLKIFEHLMASEIEIKKSDPVSKESLLYGTLIKLQSYL